MTRSARIPLDHLRVELAAYPLVSESALRLALVELDPRLEADSTREIWRAAERDILTAGPSFSLDEILAIRDERWFDGALSRPRPLAAYLQALAHHWLISEGEVANARPVLLDPGSDGLGSDDGCQAARGRRRWRWVSFALPPDLLLAALDDPLGTGPVRIANLSPVLGAALANGFAEPHLHMKAGLTFEDLWVSLMLAAALPDFRAGALRSPGAALGEGGELATWILRAAIAREQLARFLGGSGAGGLAAFVTDACARAARRFGPTVALTLDEALEGLALGTPPVADEHARLHGLYRRMIGRAEQVPVERLQAADPIARWLRSSTATPEMALVSRGLAYLSRAPRDRSFAALFWQTVRVRALLYRHVIQRPMTPGLQWFTRFYDRIRPCRKGISGTVLRSAARVSGAGAGLASLEVRISPEPSLSGLLRELRAIERGMAALGAIIDASSLELGVVLHFNRERGGGFVAGRPAARWHGTNADPHPHRCPRNLGFRYASYYRTRRREAISWAQLLRRYPASLTLVRGIDACTDELAIPTWVLVPLIRHVRRAGRQAARALVERTGEAVPPLRTSIHVGEDFVHLQSALRRIDEVIECIGLDEGDRLGHAIGLGVDPLRFADEHTQVAMAVEERLLDLAWEWRVMAAGLVGPDGPALEREIARLSRHMFSRPLTPMALVGLVDDLHRPERLSAAGFPGESWGWSSTGDGALELLRLYLTDPVVFERGRDIEWVPTRGHGPRIARLQAWLRSKVAARGLTVEVNPSSNLLVGNLTDLSSHPFWRLMPPTTSADPGSTAVAICIGSDDPITFATTLRDEYQLILDSLQLGGLAAEQAWDWLGRVRRHGLDTRFTLARRRDLAGIVASADLEPLVP